MPIESPLSRPPASAAAIKRLEQWREDLLRTVLNVAVPTGSVLVVIGTAVAYAKQDVAMGITNIAALALLLCLRHLPGFSIRARGVGMLAIVMGVGLSFLVNQIGAFSLPWLSAAPVMAALLLGRSAALLVIALICAVVFPLGYVYGLPLAPLPLLPHPAVMWSLLALNFLVLSLIIALSTAVLLRRLDQAVDQASTSQHIMSQLALVDPLTGLPNRRALRDELHAPSLQAHGPSALMLTDKGTACPCSRSCTASRQACVSIQSPSGTIRPLCSASGMNCAGDTDPIVGCTQRASSSAPTTCCAAST